MPNITKITRNGTDYFIKDATARKAGDGIRAMMQGGFETNDAVYTVEAGETSMNRELFSVELQPGTYYVSCQQDVTLASADRNRFYYIFNGNDVYEDTDRLEAGVHTWKFTATEAGTYSIRMWWVNPSTDVTLSGFTLSLFNIEQVLELQKRTVTDGSCAFRYDVYPTITYNQDQTITVTFPDSGYSPVLDYKNAAGQRKHELGNMPASAMTVAEGYSLIYDLTAGQFRTVASTADVTGIDYIFCFSNTNGYVTGPWKQYRKETEIFNASTFMEGEIFFRDNEAPTFTKSGYDYTITLPTANTVKSYCLVPGRIQIWRYATTTQTTLSVPDEGMLLYDVNNDQFVVKTGGSAAVDFYTERYIFCMINFLGHIYGPWARYLTNSRLTEAEEYISSIRGTVPVIPSYYDSYLEEKIGDINTLMAGAPDGDAFAFVTDIHIDGNTWHSPDLLREIVKKTSLDKVILNGDYIQQEHTKAAALARINKVVTAYRYDGVRTYTVVGNHEYNTNGTDADAPELSWSELYYTLVKGNENSVVRQSNGLGYYFLNEAQKIKYIVATYNKDGGMDYASVMFTLNNLTNTPSGYTIVFINHGGLNSDLTYQSGFDELVNAFDAIRNRTTYTLGNTTYDFTGADYTVACIVTGHHHKDLSATSASGMPIISTTCDARVYAEDGYTRTAGTTGEQAFDVFCINTSAKTINAVRIGAGSSRNWNY